MKRREFFKCMASVAATLVLPVALPEAEPEVMGVDMAVEGADETFVSLHGTNAATPNDLGSFLVPQEYVDELMAAMKEEDRKNNVFRGIKRVHREFAEFLRTGGAA